MNSQSNAIMSENTDVPIKEYIVNIRDKYYPDIDISFMDFFMEMYDSNELISAELLAEYRVLSIKPDRTTLDANDIKKIFKRCHLKENEDYVIRRQLAAKSKGAPKDMYYLTPKAFKICLISSSNETKYREYYLFLEECVHYYNIGQNNKLKEENNSLKEELDVTNEELSHVEEERDTLSDKLDRLIAKMDKQDIKMDTIQKSNETMQNTLNKIVNKLDNIAVPPKDDNLTERFALMKKTDNTFYVIRSQERSIKTTIAKKEKLGYSKVSDLLESELIPNSTYLWICIKDILIKENKIKCYYNDITLKNISESDLVQVINHVFDSRKDVQ